MKTALSRLKTLIGVLNVVLGAAIALDVLLFRLAVWQLIAVYCASWVIYAIIAGRSLPKELDAYFGGDSE